MRDLYNCNQCSSKGAYSGSAAPSPNHTYAFSHTDSNPHFESGLEREAQSGTIESAREEAGGFSPEIGSTNYEASSSSVYGSGVAVGNNYGTFELDKEQASKEREITDLLDADRETTAQFRETVSEGSDSNSGYAANFNQSVQQDFDLESSVNLLKRFGYEEEE